MLTAAPGASAVHPHARGEHLLRRADGRLYGGSSPRPWGTLMPLGGGPAVGRFIPTPVGNTLCLSLADLVRAVHPHARGEHPCLRGPVAENFGSSPRPWGTRRAVAGRSGEVRFIPTPVGNTRTLRSRTCALTVHPHARGEHTLFQFERDLDAGSSPRPWGTRPGR